ncbi:MAG: branched-chain amino acid ABC transporter permease [Desulfovibrionaceae bacterium]|nr:branched-chain amino acid ABC transporter permease [Desulfovibrionaceae bacterium]MBF0512452.1 branched-chain amino acid ABC transporter permease [Desulfovibrionaceae bacterium]
MRRCIVPLVTVSLLGLILAASVTDAINFYWQSVLMFMGINIILSTSLNLVNGNMGEFSCGHAGFMAVGAYVSSVLAVALFAPGGFLGGPYLPGYLTVFAFPLLLLAGGLAAAVTGLLVALPSFKTRGDYLAIITIAASYIIKSTIENVGAVGGARGFMGMAKITSAMTEVWNIPWMMLWVFAAVVFTLVVIRRYVSSTFGKGVDAVRQDEIAAEIMSVDTDRVKLVTFMLSSGLAGIAGGLFAFVLGYINPGSFTIIKSTEAMVMVYLGGMGSISGAALSAVAFTLLMEVLRPMQVGKWVIIPMMLILLMQFRPEGFFGHRELTDIFPGLRRLLGREESGK